MNGRIEFTGGPELAAKLTALPDRVMENVARQGVLAGAKVMADAVTRAAPILVDTSSFFTHSPGLLKKSIGAWRRRGTRDEATACVSIAKEAWYWRLVEYGHTIRHKAKGRIFGHVPPHPFARPAIDGSKAAAVQALADYMGPRVEKEAESANLAALYGQVRNA